VSNPFEVETLHGTVVIAFGVNRWVLVSIGGDEAQSQVGSRHELAAYLRTRGLSDREASEFSQRAWKQRPGDAADHLARPDDGLVSATGFSSGRALLVVVAFVAAWVLIILYLFSGPR